MQSRGLISGFQAMWDIKVKINGVHAGYFGKKYMGYVIFSSDSGISTGKTLILPRYGTFWRKINGKWDTQTTTSPSSLLGRQSYDVITIKHSY